jgi:hypothetical protein
MRNSAKQRGVHGENAAPGHGDTSSRRPGNQANLTMAHLEDPNPKPKYTLGRHGGARAPYYTQPAIQAQTQHTSPNHPQGSNKPVKTKNKPKPRKHPANKENGVKWLGRYQCSINEGTLSYQCSNSVRTLMAH